MATRLYFSSTIAAEVSPAFGSQWAITTNATRLYASMSKTGSALTAETGSSYAETTTSVGNLLHKQYVTDPIPANQTISGTFSAVIKGVESATAADGSLQVVLRVVSDDGTTERGVLYAGHAATLNSTAGALGQEFPTTTAATRLIPAGTALSSVAALAGDRLVIEWGHRHHNTSATSYNVALTFGDAASTAAFALTAALTTSLLPWLEFSANIPLAQPASTVVETFDSQNTTLWTGYGTDVTAVAGRLQIANTAAFPSLNTVEGYDLRGSEFYVEADLTAVSAAATTYVGIYATTHADNEAQFQWNNNILTFRETTANVDSDTTLAYNATTHRWWRLRESGGSILWDTSPDGTTWTNRRTKATTIVYGNPVLGIFSGDTAATAGSFSYFDNVNTLGAAPALPPESIRTYQAVNRAATY